MKRLLLVLIVLMIVSGCASGKKPLPCTLSTPMPAAGGSAGFVHLGTIVGGAVGAVSVQADYAYLGVGSTLVTLDVTDPVHPRQVGSVLLPGEVSSIAVVGSHAYVDVGGGRELHVVDVSDPGRPTLAGYLEGCPAAVKALAGDYAFVSGWDTGLRVLDVANPSAPVEVGTYQPASPTGLVLLPRPELIRSRLMKVLDVAVSGQYAYVAESLMGYDVLYNGRLRVLDISNPAKPKPIAVYAMPDDTGAMGVEVFSDHVFVFTKGGLVDSRVTVVLDVSEPADPVEVGRLASDGPHAIFDHYAYFYDPSADRMSIWDVSHPSTPLKIGSIDLPASWYVYLGDLAFADHYVYVAMEHSGLGVIDVANPAAPRMIGTTSYSALDGVEGLAVIDHTAYLAGGGAMWVVDFADLDELNVLSFLGGFTVQEIAVVGSYAYLADALDGLLVVDVSEPESPTLAGTYDSADICFGRRVAVGGGYAYLICRGEGGGDVNMGIRVIDVSDPSDLIDIGVFEVPTSCHHDIAVFGDFAYVAAQSGKGSGLWVLDVSDPARPVEVGVYDGAGSSFYNVTVDGGYAFVADSSTLQVIDVRDPTSMIERGVYHLPSPATDIQAADGKIYVALKYGGMLILEFHPPAS